MADQLVHLHINARHREIKVYAAGSTVVRTVKTALVSAHDGVAHAQLDADNGQVLVDLLAAATGHYPATLDAQSDHARMLADELAARRANGDELAALAHARYLGHLVADMAEAIYQLHNEFMGDRTVAEMFAELASMADALRIGDTLTNPGPRVDAHHARITELREQLPPRGDTPT